MHLFVKFSFPQKLETYYCVLYCYQLIFQFKTPKVSVVGLGPTLLTTINFNFRPGLENDIQCEVLGFESNNSELIY